jgi:DNA repair protein RadD
MELNLREHQLKVIDSLREGFKAGHRTQVLYAPTGFGKTEIAIYLMKATADKGYRAAMVLDRLVLVDQTSLRLSKYGLDHGVMQADHWKYNSSELIQVCSAQTLERREDFPKVDLLIVDECHIMRKQIVEYIKSNPGMRVVGLTATPFTKGMGLIYENVVCGSTTGALVGNKWLAPLRVFIAKPIDMTGAKKVAGEWSQDEASVRGMKITGDIVQEWARKTHEIFGRPRKTIVFCAGVAHGRDLVDQFKRKGYNFVSISYKDTDEDKRQAIEDFAKPDTEIHGLIATDILTRGFDVPDVMIGVSARPFSKSLSSHIQQLGRVMRPYPEKNFAVWLDHSGNYLRCPSCGFLWDKQDLTCPSCGHARPIRSGIDSIAGVLEELKGGKKTQKDDKQMFYSQLIWIAKERNYNRGWVSHKYKEKFGVWPRDLAEVPSPPSMPVLNWVRSRNIAWAKTRRVA